MTDTYTPRRVYLSGSIPPIPATFRARLEDFCVEERIAYEPCGVGEHLFVHFEKRDLTTPEATKRIARALGADPKHTGYAGLKDRHALTSQWASFQVKDAPESAAQFPNIEGVHVREVKRHGNKLRTGHLRANAFRITLRDVPEERLGDFAQVLAVINESGLPNLYGPQRFPEGALDRAVSYVVEQERPPRSRFDRKWLVSVLQSAAFNWVLRERFEKDLLHKPLKGDLVKKTDTGGMFVAEDLIEVSQRMANKEVVATGPMFGADMRFPEADARALEEQAMAAFNLNHDMLKRVQKAGAGSRRALLVFPSELSHHTEVNKGAVTITLNFSLPPGSYATTLVDEIRKCAAPPQFVAAP